MTEPSRPRPEPAARGNAHAGEMVRERGLEPLRVLPTGTSIPSKLCSLATLRAEVFPRKPISPARTRGCGVPRGLGASGRGPFAHGNDLPAPVRPPAAIAGASRHARRSTTTSRRSARHGDVAPASSGRSAPTASRVRSARTSAASSTPTRCSRCCARPRPWRRTSRSSRASARSPHACAPGTTAARATARSRTACARASHCSHRRRRRRAARAPSRAGDRTRRGCRDGPAPVTRARARTDEAAAAGGTRTR